MPYWRLSQKDSVSLCAFSVLRYVNLNYCYTAFLKALGVDRDKERSCFSLL